MFKTLPILTNNGFLRVSAGTKTCGSPLYLAGILTHFQTKVKKKTATENADFAEKAAKSTDFSHRFHRLRRERGFGSAQAHLARRFIRSSTIIGLKTVKIRFFYESCRVFGPKSMFVRKKMCFLLKFQFFLQI